jgi:hypothetical protein
MFLYLFQQNPLAAVAFVVGILAGIVVHEAAHATSAYSLGDDTAYREGRVTLNPVAHLELLSVLMIFMVGVGWGSTPVTPSKLRGGLWGPVAVAAAGPASNLIVVALCAVLLQLPAFGGGYLLIMYQYGPVILIGLLLVSVFLPGISPLGFILALIRPLFVLLGIPPLPV